MQDFDGPRSLQPVKAAPVVVVVLAATMIGAPCGVFIADRDAFLSLEKNLASQLASVRGYVLGSADTTTAKPETPTVIPTGLPSIVAIRYSSDPGSTRMSFDLEAADLVRTGKLRSPDRIYFDLRDHGREPGTLKGPISQKVVSIAGSLLAGVRISQRKRGATRIVLDLKRSCDFTYQTSPGPPSRLMVEIRPAPTAAAESE